jgi:hypothetical protein
MMSRRMTGPAGRKNSLEFGLFPGVVEKRKPLE